jgi:hypothetical protein
LWWRTTGRAFRILNGLEFFKLERKAISLDHSLLRRSSLRIPPE